MRRTIPEKSLVISFINFMASRRPTEPRFTGNCSKRSRLYPESKLPPWTAMSHLAEFVIRETLPSQVNRSRAPAKNRQRKHTLFRQIILERWESQ